MDFDYTEEHVLEYGSGSETLLSQPPYAPFKNYEFGPNVGLGYMVNFFNLGDVLLQAKYRRGFGLTPGVQSDHFMFSLGYQFGKR